MFLHRIGLHFVTEPEIQGEIGTQAPIVLNIYAKNFVAHIMLVARRQIGRSHRNAWLVCQKVDESPARRLNAAATSGAVRPCHCGGQSGCKGGAAVYPVYRQGVILLSEKFKTGL